MEDLVAIQEARRKQIEDHAAEVMAEDAASHVEGHSVVQWTDPIRSYDQPFETESQREVPVVVDVVETPAPQLDEEPKSETKPKKVNAKSE